MVRHILTFEARQKASLLLERIWKVEVNKRFIAIMTRSLSREPDSVYIFTKDGKELLELSFKKINDIASTEESIVILPAYDEKVYIIKGPFDITSFKVGKGYFFLRVIENYLELCGSECVVYDLEGNKVGEHVLTNRRWDVSLTILGDRVIERCGNKTAIAYGNVLGMFKRGKPVWKRRFLYGISAVFFDDKCEKVAVFSEVNDIIYVVDAEKGLIVGSIELRKRGLLEKLLNYLKWKLGMYMYIPFSSVLWKENRLAVVTWDKVLIFET